MLRLAVPLSSCGHSSFLLWPWLGPPLTTVQFIMSFVDDVTFSQSVPYKVQLISSINVGAVLKQVAKLSNEFARRRHTVDCCHMHWQQIAHWVEV